jgi:hypothetical protein
MKMRIQQTVQQIFMTKRTALPLLIILHLLWGPGLLSAQDLDTHHAYKVTSYNLGAFQGSQDNGGTQNIRGFKPLLITGGAADILNSEHQKTVALSEESTSSSLSGIALSAQFEATDNISIQGSFGVTRNLWSPDLIGGVSGSSWEANLGIVYKLLNNISYELHFGYMDTGKLFTDRSSYTDVENIIMISNQLTLSF